MALAITFSTMRGVLLLVVATAAVILLTAEHAACKAVHSLANGKTLVFDTGTGTIKITHGSGDEAGFEPIDEKSLEELKAIFKKIAENPAGSFYIGRSLKKPLAHDVEVIVVPDPGDEVEPQEVNRRGLASSSVLPALSDGTGSTEAAQSIVDETPTDVLLPDTPEGRCILCGAGDCPACYRPDSNGNCRQIYGCTP